MTEALRKWATEKSSPSFSDPEAAEFWIRAFCDDLEARAGDCDVSDFCSNYERLKRELLGDK